MLETFKRGFRRWRQGSQVSVLHRQTLVVFLAHPLYAQAIRAAFNIQLLDHLQSIHSRWSDTEVCHFDVSR